MKLQSGHEVVPIEREELEKQLKDFEGYKDGLVRLNPGRWLFPSAFTNFADKYYNFKFKSTDVVIMTWPKCGTTWTQEIVWTMRNNAELNHPMAHLPILARSTFLDFDIFLGLPKSGVPMAKNRRLEAFNRRCPGKNPADGMNIQMAEVLDDPRTIKVHLPFSLLPPSLLDTCKVVYTARNPKDVIVSYHHHCRFIKGHGYVGSFEDYVQYFVDDNLVYGPYWLNMKEAWEKRDHPNMHIMFYEDMKAKPIEELRKLNTFLNTNLTEKQLENIVEYTSFSVMKERSNKDMSNEEELGDFNVDVIKKDGGFFRKGQSGDWKGKLTPALECKVDKWIEKNMTSFGVNFKYGI